VIYILSPGAEQSQALVRLLKQGGCSDTVVGVRLSGEPKLRSRGLFDKVITQDNLRPAMKGDVLVPTGARSTEWLLGGGDCSVGAIVHSRTSLKVFDKPWLLSQAVEIAIPVPVTWTSTDDFGISDFPVFYKEHYEKGGGLRGLAMNEQDLPSAPAGQLIFQEYIESRGTYGVGFLAKDGDVLVAYAHYESSSYPSTGGSAVILEECLDPKPVEYTKRLVGHIAYSGWGLAEFKYCPDRMDYVLMEINAKFWASCEFAFRNEPEFLRLLFEVSSEDQWITRMVFLNRAFARGPRYMKKHRHEILDSRRVLYSGWRRNLLLGWLPNKVKKGILAVRLTLKRLFGLNRATRVEGADAGRP